MENPSLKSLQTKKVLIDGREWEVIIYPRGRSAHVPQPRQARRDTVGVYLLGSANPESYRMSIDTARSLRNLGLADFINRKCDIRLRRPPQIQHSQATIRKSELEANAGLFGRSRTAHLPESRRQELLSEGFIKREEDFVERSMGKVALWPAIGDTKAVRVGPTPDLAALEQFL